MATHSNISSLQLQKQLGLGSYNGICQHFPRHLKSSPSHLEPKYDSLMNDFLLKLCCDFTGSKKRGKSTRSWINQVERWFAELTRKQLQRGAHTSVKDLEPA
jgi:hypothetical protein